MLSISSQRVLSRLGVSLRLSRVTANSSLLSARRSFVTSVPRCEAAAAGGETSDTKMPTAKTAKKATSKAATKAGTKTIGKVASKKQVAKEPKVKKPTHLKLTKEDMPPKHPGSSYTVFLVKYLQSHSGEHRKQESHAAVMKDVSSMWNNLTEAEKQPFVDDYHRARALYGIKRQAYFDKVPTAVLKEINRRRVSRGMKRIRAPQTGTKRALSSYLRFLADFRETAEAAEIRQTTESRNANIPIVKAAGEKWRSLGEEAKAPYTAEAKKDMDAYHQAKAEAKTA